MEAQLSYQNSIRQTSNYLTPLYEWRPHGDSVYKTFVVKNYYLTVCNRTTIANNGCTSARLTHIKSNRNWTPQDKVRITNYIRISERNSVVFGHENSGNFQRPKDYCNTSFGTKHNKLKNQTSGGVMARLNLEDQFFLDALSVAAKMGDEDKAIGNAARFLRYAQEHHKAGKLISENEFKNKRFSEALFPDFAERVEGGIRAIGATKHFGWLDQKIEAGSRGGKTSAKRPRDAKGRLLKSNLTPSELQANSKPSQPSPSPSPSPSCSPSHTHKEENVCEKKNSTRKEISSSLKQNVSFQQKDLNDIGQALDQLFGEQVPRRKELSIAVLAAMRGDGDATLAELQKIYEVPECRGKGIPKDKRYPYVLRVIEKRFGL